MVPYCQWNDASLSMGWCLIVNGMMLCCFWNAASTSLEWCFIIIGMLRCNWKDGLSLEWYFIVLESAICLFQWWCFHGWRVQAAAGARLHPAEPCIHASFLSPTSASETLFTLHKHNGHHLASPKMNNRTDEAKLIEEESKLLVTGEVPLPLSSTQPPYQSLSLVPLSFPFP